MTNIRGTIVLNLLGNTLVMFIAMPLMYSDVDFNPLTDSRRLIYMLVSTFFLLVLGSSLVLISNLFAVIKRQGMEYFKLLNWINVGVILRAENKEVRFTNKQANKLF